MALACELPESHPRRAIPTKHLDAPPTDVGWRIFDCPTCSSQLLMHLLVRWASPSKSHVQKSESSRLSWEVMLRGVMELAVSQHPRREIHFFMTLHRCEPGKPLLGEDLISLAVSVDGLVDLSPVLASENPLADVMRLAVPPLQERLPLLNLLVLLDKIGKKAATIHRQLVNELASLLDQAIHAQSDVRNPKAKSKQVGETSIDLTASRFGTAAKRRGDKVARKKKVIQWRDKNRRRTVWRHCLAARQALQGQRCVSAAFDASRLGGKGQMFGAIHGGQLTAWLPPQVLQCPKRAEMSQVSRGRPDPELPRTDGTLFQETLVFPVFSSKKGPILSRTSRGHSGHRSAGHPDRRGFHTAG